MTVYLKRGIKSLEQGSAPASPAAGSRLIYPKSDGWYEKSSAGVESKVGPLTGTKVSALAAVTTPAGTDEIPVNQAGTTKKLTLSQVNAFCEPVVAASTAGQGPGFSTDTYVTGSSITLPAGRIQAGTQYRLILQMTKSAAGVAAPTFNFRCGTAGSTADASMGSALGQAQTAALDNAIFELRATFRTVGSGTSAVLVSLWRLTHNAVSNAGVGTGFSLGVGLTAGQISSGFNSTTAGLKLGLSINAGASAAWTINMVQADLTGLL